MGPSMQLTRLCVLFLGLLFTAPYINGQTIEQRLITGRVRSSSLAPLPGAQVAALDLETGAVCDIDGYFRFLVPPRDSLRLEISYMGYESQQVFVRPALWQDSLLVITLNPTTLWFSPVVILGESSFEKLKSAEPSLRIIHQSDITSVPSIAGPDVFRALQALPGVHSTSELSNQLYIRGGTPDQNLVLYNGVPLYQPFHLFGLASSVDALGVDYIKYYSGGFSAQYGDRLSGVLDIVTKPGGDSLETRLDWNPFNVGGTLSGALSPKWRWRLTGRRAWLDVITRLADLDLGYGYYDLEGKLSWLPNPRHLVTFNLFRSQDNYGRASNTTVYNPIYEYHPDPAVAKADSNTVRRIDQNQIDWGNQLASLKWVARHSERITSELTVYASQLRQRVDNVNAYFAHDSASQSTLDYVEGMNNEHRYIATSRSVLASSGLTDVGINLNGRAELPAWGEIASGISMQRRRLDYNWNSTELEVISPYINIFMDFPPDTLDFQAAPRSAAGFLEVTFRRVPRIVLRGGLRVSKHSRIPEWIVTPRLNANWRFRPHWQFKAAWGQFSQLLSTSAEYGFYSVASLLFPPGGDTISMATHYLAGLSYDNKTGLAVEMMFYRKDYSHLLYIDRDHSTAFGPAWGSGWELSLVYSPRDDLTVQTAYTYAVARKRQADETFYPNYDQRHKINAIVRLPQLRRWEPTLSWSFNTGRPANLEESVYLAGQIDNYDPSYESSTASILPWPFMLPMPKNFLRYPAYHRLDLMLSRSKQTSKGRRTFYLQVVNLYARKNVIYYDDIVRERKKSEDGEGTRDVWKATGFNGFPFLPLVGLSYEY